MRIRNLLPLLVPLLLLTGCTAEEQSAAGAGMTPVSLTVSQSGMRAGTAVQSTQFDANQSFYVYFPTNVTVGSTTTASHTTYTTTNASGNTTPTTQPYFNAGATSAVVHAYYPSTVTNTTSSFSVLNDQTGDGNYKASDLMYANIASLSKSGATVTGNLTFSHRMSKIIANVTAGTGVSVIKKVRIIGGYRTIAISTPLTCTLSTAAGALSNAVSDTEGGCVKMYENATGASHVQCAALLPPQTINGAFLKVETDQGSVTYSLASKTLASANCYTFTITVNAAAIGSTVAITGWTDNGNATVSPTKTNAPAGAVAVDLGLPSGTKWANMNIGATSVTGYGTYFAWGETSGYTSESDYAKKHFSWDTYAWCKGTETTLTKYCPEGNSNWWDTGGTTVAADKKTQLEFADDAARANWGGAWRMPTYADFEELISETDNVWVANYNGTGVNGYKFTNKTDNTKFIFLPAAGYRNRSSFYNQGSYGYYWSSTLYSDNPYYAWYLDFYGGDVYTYDFYRYFGQGVRAVLKN
ncbi:MAG: fimbrillin family protein [Prevotella sp.]|nr:fimbrillin family protein [Prevotella sp.]